MLTTIDWKKYIDNLMANNLQDGPILDKNDIKEQDLKQKERVKAVLSIWGKNFTK